MSSSFFSALHFLSTAARVLASITISSWRVGHFCAAEVYPDFVPPMFDPKTKPWVRPFSGFFEKGRTLSFFSAD